MQTQVRHTVFELNQLIVPPGNKVRLQNVSWEMYESILEELGEGYAVRLAYYKGTLEIRMPLPKHEKAKSLIGYLVNVLLEELNIDCEVLGSTTFKRQDMQTGVEPDDCFYIQNQGAVRGKDRLDLTVDPPPDLAIEIDNSSQTSLNCYEALGVPELWRYDGEVLKIYRLQEGKYTESSTSQNFPDFPIIDLIPQYVDRSKTEGRSPTIRAFRAWVREQLQAK
ncbi:MAG: Uma2 family endonuclease [Tychonema bourrellyi B0820]|uniref:Uma2 family endonuclease n=1 Tax=Tychonema bourrellyi FEM_GT703 TaxID=2040638 RepID=A0A2G4F4E0_9CYAN|nr:Uma2 family endonuclease [Tychonema bourrellyi]MDQ2099046.1 Uma2 family endonuclease [Tychonema bourrellyi B0820]PHX56608.1 Uma2 family endonuclease [Tychonema bourrellyi FEM_GT703]